MQHLKHRAPAITVLIGALLFILFFFGKFIHSPNENLLIENGDGLKSYYVLKYHVENDSTYLHFTGMNYPFGEHYGFTDGFPVLAWLMQSLPFLQPYAISIIHLSIFFSYVLCAFFVFLILKKFKVNPWFAAIAALSILFLQPQTARITGHLSLSYAVFFPLSWYLLLQLTETKKKVWMGVLILNTLFWFYMHAYLGLMIVLFSGLVFFLRLFFHEREERIWNFKQILWITFPLLFFFLFTKITDPITDRPTDPIGFFEYTASPETVFLPNHPPFAPLLNPLFSVQQQQWEGWSYIGMSANVVLLVFFVLFILALFQKDRKHNIINQLFFGYYHVYFIASLFILLFAMGYPFRWYPDILDVLKPLKQFRGLGRFAWVFFYVSTIYAVLLIHHHYQSRKESVLKNYMMPLVAVLMVALNVYEGYPMNESQHQHLNAKNVFEKKHLTNEEKQLIQIASAQNIQAVMTLPYFHVGSEIFVKEPPQTTLKMCFLLSYYLKKPIYGVMMGRTSFAQSLDYMRSFGPDHIEKNMKKYIPSGKKILVYYGGEKLWEEEELLKSRLQKIYSENGKELFLADPSTFFKMDSSYTKANFFHKADTLIKKDNLTLSALPGKDFIVENFSQPDSFPGHVTNGRYSGNIKDFNILATLPPHTLHAQSEYETGFEYFHTSGPVSVNNVLIMQTSLPEGGGIVWTYERCLFTYPVQEKGKTIFRTSFIPSDTTKVFQVFLKGPENDARFELDNFYLRKKNIDILREEKTDTGIKWYWNNFEVK